MCSQCLLLPALLQQCPGHGLLLPTVPKIPRNHGGTCWALPELPMLPGPDREGLKIKTNGRLRSFYSQEVSGCVAPSEEHEAGM